MHRLMHPIFRNRSMTCPLWVRKQRFLEKSIHRLRFAPWGHREWSGKGFWQGWKCPFLKMLMRWKFLRDDSARLENSSYLCNWNEEVNTTFYAAKVFHSKNQNWHLYQCCFLFFQKDIPGRKRKKKCLQHLFCILCILSSIFIQQILTEAIHESLF